MTDADVLNRIERRVLNGKATDREKRILVEAYQMHGMIMSDKLIKKLGY